MDKNRNVSNADNSGLDISFMEMWLALRNGYIIILLASFLGLMVQGIRYYQSDRVFEARALIQLASIHGLQNQDRPSNEDFAPASSFGIRNYLDSAIVISLLRNPTTYSQAMIDICSLPGQPITAEKIASTIVLNKYMGVNSLLELKVFGPSPDIAVNCTMSIIEKLSSFESVFTKSYYANLNRQLKALDIRITDIRNTIVVNDNKGERPIITSIFLMNDLYKLQAQKDIIVNVLSGEPTQNWLLVGEVYSSGKQISKSLRSLLFEGLVVGVLIGLIAIFMNLAIRKIKF
jgi:hypothetical protein